jgi:antitoxin component of MazEF toxin-antitoxin module
MTTFCWSSSFPNLQLYVEPKVVWQWDDQAEKIKESTPTNAFTTHDQTAHEGDKNKFKVDEGLQI